jgi:hypothetical protein
MKSIIRRIEILEKEIGSSCPVPKEERFITIPYPDGENEIFERLKQEKIRELRARYGDISEDDLFVIGIRLFGSKEVDI